MKSLGAMMPSSCLDTRSRPLTCYARRVMAVAFVLCPLFLVVMGYAWLESLVEDFPDHSAWVERIWSVVGFFMGFPLLFATGFEAPFGVSHALYVFTGVAVDGLFWAFAGVLVLRLFRWIFRPKMVFK